MAEENQEVADGAGSAGEKAPAENFEREARIQGWVPSEQFRGREDEWVDAETFVRRGRELNPILRANNRRLIKEVEELRAAQHQTAQAINEFRAYHEETEARTYAKAIADLKQQRKAALLDGDNAAALAAEEGIDALDAEMYQVQQAKKRTTPRQQAQQPDSPVTHADIKDFTDRNEWFSVDKVKTGIAMALGEQLHVEQPQLVGRSFLAELEERLVEQFPAQFGNPRRQGASKMEGGGSDGPRGRGTRGKTAADLPADARAAMNKYVKAGLLTEKQYLADFFAE